MLYACGQESPLGVWKSVNIGRERGNTKFSGVSFYRARWIIVSVVVEYGNKCIFSFQDTAEGKQSGTANRGKWKEMERSKRRRGKKLFSFSLPLRCTFYRVQIIMNERITLIGPFKL